MQIELGLVLSGFGAAAVVIVDVMLMRIVHGERCHRFHGGRRHLRGRRNHGGQRIGAGGVIAVGGRVGVLPVLLAMMVQTIGGGGGCGCAGGRRRRGQSCRVGTAGMRFRLDDAQLGTSSFQIDALLFQLKKKHS